MSRKVYCHENLEYLVRKNNTSHEKLMGELDMGWLQYRHCHFPKASNLIADYFGVSLEEFRYVDLSMPQAFRFLSDSEEKDIMCERLLGLVTAEKDRWKIVDANFKEGLDTSQTYRQITLYLVNDDYEFVIQYKNTTDSSVEKGFKIFPEQCYAYGYVNYGEGFKQYFLSSNDNKFKQLCDELLYVKQISWEQWSVNERLKRENGIRGSFEFSQLRDELKDHAFQMMAYSLFFDKDEFENETEEEQLNIINKTLELMEVLKNKKNFETLDWNAINPRIKKFLINHLKIEETSGDELQNSIEKYEHELLQIRKIIEKDIENIEKEELEQEKERQEKTLLLQEIYEAEKCIGNWSEEDMSSFALGVSKMTFEEFVGQLKMIGTLFEEFQNRGMKYSERQLKLLQNFLWAKRIYVYSFEQEKNEMIFDQHMLLGEWWDEEKVKTLLRFINAYKNNCVDKYYLGLSNILAEILIVLFAFKKETFKQIEFLYLNVEKDEDVRSTLLENIYEDMCVINCLKDETTEKIERKQCENTCDIWKLNNALWTDFFECTDDKVMYRAFGDVWCSVNELFSKYDLRLNSFVEGREGKKKFHIFRLLYNSNLDELSAIVKIPRPDCTFVRNEEKYIFEDGVLYVEGLLDTIELRDQNNFYYSYSLIDRFLVTYIWKYMENYLRVLSKYKSKCSYKYGGYHCFNPFINDEDTLVALSHDYEILKKLIESGELKKAIYDGMASYFDKYQDEMEWWKDRFILNNN